MARPLSNPTKAKRIAIILDELYPETPVPLDHSDPYTLLVAVLLSAQCTDVRVNLVTPHLFAKARTPQAMILLTTEEIREIIKPCGLSPTKSKAIWELSNILINQHNGIVPQSWEHLEALPGYAPDLSPLDQGCWHHLKDVQLANLSCMDMEELHLEFHLAIGRLRQKPQLIRSFFAAAGLSL